MIPVSMQTIKGFTALLREGKLPSATNMMVEVAKENPYLSEAAMAVNDVQSTNEFLSGFLMCYMCIKQQEKNNDFEEMLS